MMLNSINTSIDLIKTQLEASSCTFYLRDPFWRNELRLIAMSGIEYLEPMYGFRVSRHSKGTADNSELEIFSSDVEKDKRFRKSSKLSLSKIPKAKKFLFGDFIEREKIKSSARLLLKEDNVVEAVLFVNYKKQIKFTKAIKEKIRAAFVELTKNLKNLQNELKISEMEDINQVIKIFSPTYDGSRNILYQWNQPRKEYFHSLLSMLIESIPNIKSDEIFGTIHLYDPRTHTLNIIARTENIASIPKIESLSVLNGDGVASWVAIRETALLINDLSKSKFSDVHWTVKRGIKSEVTIPIFDEENLLAIFNLESFQPNAFHPSYVRSLWFAANQIAAAYKFSDINSKLKDLNTGLLELCEESVNNNTGKLTLDKLAILAKKHLAAARCDIWRYNSNKYELAGISHSDFIPNPPRPSGISDHVKAIGCQAVWLTKIKKDTSFLINYWKDKTWNEGLDEKSPDSINSSVVKYEVKELLGIPIMVRGKYSGIAWLEYTNGQDTPPDNELMRLAHGFAAHAGLIIEFSQVDLVEKAAVRSIGESISENLLLQGPIKLPEFPHLEVFIKSCPSSNSPIGGDFYAVRAIDNQTAYALLGDGESHGVTGTINMLPMMTVFETSWNETRSVTHIMDKMMNASNKLGVRGTAIYCVFSMIGKQLWLSATSAGHKPMVIIKNGLNSTQFPLDDKAFGLPLGYKIKSPLVEEHCELSSGDLIIVTTDGLDFTNTTEPEDVNKLELILRELRLIGLRNFNSSLSEIADIIFDKSICKNNDNALDDATVLLIRVK